MKGLQKSAEVHPSGMEGMRQICPSADTIESILISKSEALLDFEGERYEVTVTIYSDKDSMIYLSAVNSGFEILRAGVDRDSIRVIDRLNKIVYRTPLKKRFGYQHPVSFDDLQNLISRYYMCDDLDRARNDSSEVISFEFDDPNIKKRIWMDGTGLKMNKFEFYHGKTGEYLMGERISNGMKIYSNFMISGLEIVGRGGTVAYNRTMKVKMNVNPARYSFVELQ
jgi:hypothetical protein